MTTDHVYWLFAATLLATSVMVTTARNPIYSVLFLVLAFFQAAGILVLAGLDFFALVFLVVYVGAVAVLFLFVVMMLDIKASELAERRARYLPVAGLMAVLLLAETLLLVDLEGVALGGLPAGVAALDWTAGVEPLSTIQAMSRVLYTVYVGPFLLAGMVLLLAMVATIALTMTRGVSVRRQSVALQNRREWARTVVRG